MLTVETVDGPSIVEPGETLFVPAAAPNPAHNDGDDPVEFLAVGAPKDSDGAVIAEECPNCDAVIDRRHEAVQEENGTVYRLFCTDCGAETGLLTPGPASEP